MRHLSLKPGGASSLTDQIVEQTQQLIDTRELRPGARMPSIRRFAKEHGVSSFTVVTAYDRLVALGYVSSRRGSGFFVAQRPELAHAPERPSRLEQSLQSLAAMENMPGQKLAFAVPHLMASIAGKRPASKQSAARVSAMTRSQSWLMPQLVQRGLRSIARDADSRLVNYGEPYGHGKLREFVVGRLAEMNVEASLHGIVTTHGASHGFDLIARYLVRPGDAVLVEDPGYLILYRHLKLLGARLVAVPRTPAGPDPVALETAIRAHKPRLFFLNTLLQNPTGSSISPAVAHRIVHLAEEHDLLVVEDDVYCDLADDRAMRLAALDQLRHVIYVGSYSKTVSCNLRVGFIACNRELAEELVDIKVLTGLTTCEANERLVHEVLSGGRYRKHVLKLRQSLERKREATLRRLEGCGLEPFCRPDGGIFLWARFPGIADSKPIAQLAAQSGIALVPGNLFRPTQQASPWMRFNAAFCEDAQMFRALEKISRELACVDGAGAAPRLQSVPERRAM